MARLQNPNLEILVLAVDQLGQLTEEMVFVGGCATGLLITDIAAPPIRVTRDVVKQLFIVFYLTKSAGKRGPSLCALASENVNVRYVCIFQSRLKQ